jgi:hypothetical protein
VFPRIQEKKGGALKYRYIKCKLKLKKVKINLSIYSLQNGDQIKKDDIDV